MSIFEQNKMQQSQRQCPDWIIGACWLIAMLLMLILLSLPRSAFGQVSQRTTAVQTLLENSSAAKRVAESEDAEVKILYENARKFYELAIRAQENGDEVKANQYLNEAVAEMTRATQLAGSGESKLKKRQDEYESKLRSVESLLTAYQRIIEEKPIEGSADTTQKIQGHIDSAADYMSQGDISGAAQQLDYGYEIVITAVEQLRQGETLVRSLNFASKEEEFEYELDRNDTHKMLLKVLITEKSTPSQMAASFIEKANELRLTAEKYSAEGKFEEAVKTIEESTKNLVRAIRSSGVYIPG